MININYWMQTLYSRFIIFTGILSEEVMAASYAGFVLANYILVDQLIKRIEKWDVIDLLWKLLVIGITGIILVFLLWLIEDLTIDQNIFAHIRALSSSVALYATLIFSLSTIFIFRKLILYQKNKRKVFTWNVLQVLFLLGLLRLFMEIGMGVAADSGSMDQPFGDEGLLGAYNSILLSLFLIVTLVLSANVNWSAYLNFNQKLRSLFLLAIIIILFGAFLLKFPFNALPDVEDPLQLLFSKYVIFGMLFLFPFVYALLSGLVLIFNLQTSSVFEQRNIELATIQHINQSIQSNLDEEEILRTLLDASLLTSNATGGWIETFPEEERGSRISYSKNVAVDEIELLRSREDLSKVVVDLQRYVHIKNVRKHKSFRYAKTRIRSLLAMPIQTSKKVVGVVFLVNELSASFEEQSIQSLVGLTEQSGISIENAELVARSIDLEIYREQLKIAKTFQKQILPQQLPGTDRIEFFVRSQEVDEIGGDFYDVTQRGQTYKIAVGDVSGKGTTAAFYMAETKGIFQALTQLDMGVRDFILNANMALSHCLRKSTFMTLTYLHIDMDKNEIELLRAGHCQTLYYDSTTDTLKSLESGSPGLAIIRKPSFADYVPEPDKFNFHPEDLLILFTDGIIEAHNREREEFGFGRLKDIVYRLRKTDSRLIAETLVQQVKAFTGGYISDDYSILVIKFL